QAQRAQHFLDPGRVGRATEHAAGIVYRVLDPREHVECQFLRHEADAPPHLAPVPLDVEPERLDRPAAGPEQAAYGTDQRGLAGSVGAEQREDLALADLQVDTRERRGAALVGL